MRKVLVIAYAFPPIGGGGVQRSVKFVKYLREFNWEPVVLTVANPSVPAVDEALCRDIPGDVNIYKAITFEPSYAKKKQFTAAPVSLKGKLKQNIKQRISNVLLPDMQILWWPGLTLTLIKVLRKERPKCIFVTAPPFSSFVPVLFIGNIFRIPVVIDFRDEWAYSRDQLENLSKSHLAKKLDGYLEKHCVSNCAAFTAASDSYVEDLVAKYDIKNKEKGLCVTNGFDEDDFLDGYRKIRENSGMIDIVFSGTVWKGTSLKKFLAALEKIIENVPSLKDRLRVKIFGKIVDSEMRYFQSETLKEVIEIHGYIEHCNIIKEILNADILLMAITDSRGANKIILGKTFEYMATGNHIFALIPEGESERLLRNNYENVTIIQPGNIDDISNAFLFLIENIGSVRQRQAKDVAQFSRRKLTQKLARFLSETTQHRV